MPVESASRATRSVQAYDIRASTTLRRIPVLFPRITVVHRTLSCFALTHVRSFLALSVLLSLPILDAAAQEYRAPAAGSGIQYFTYVNPGEPSVRLMVVGSATTGMYEVGIETTLAELLVFANGANVASSSSNTRTTVKVKLYRGDDVRRDVIYEASMEELLTNPGESPQLMEGDIFLVDAITRTRFSWREMATYISMIASLTIIIGRIAGQF